VGHSGDSCEHTRVIVVTVAYKVIQDSKWKFQQRVVRLGIGAKALKKRGGHPLRHNGEHNED
jgi:hypothetical protein